MRPKTLLPALLLAAVTVLAASPALALGVGSPALPVDLGGTVLSGAIGYAAFELGDTDVDTKGFLLKASFGPTAGVSPYLKIGFLDLSADGGFEGSLGFAYGVGALVPLVRPEGDGGLTVSLDGQALWHESSEGGVDARVFQGQLALVGALRSGGTSGYAGLASSFITVDGAGGDLDQSGKGHLFFGVDYFLDFNFYLNAEAHLFGEDSVAFGVGYKF